MKRTRTNITTMKDPETGCTSSCLPYILLRPVWPWDRDNPETCENSSQSHGYEYALVRCPPILITRCVAQMRKLTYSRALACMISLPQTAFMRMSTYNAAACNLPPAFHASPVSLHACHGLEAETASSSAQRRHIQVAMSSMTPCTHE